MLSINRLRFWSDTEFAELTLDVNEKILVGHCNFDAGVSNENMQFHNLEGALIPDDTLEEKIFKPDQSGLNEAYQFARDRHMQFSLAGMKGFKGRYGLFFPMITVIAADSIDLYVDSDLDDMIRKRKMIVCNKIFDEFSEALELK